MAAKKAPQRTARTVTKSRHFGSKDALYESLKLSWVSQHPNACSADYEAAMIKIARRAGI